MQPYVEMDEVAINAVNNLNGVFSQIKAGERLAAIKLSSAGEGIITLGTNASPVSLATYADQAIAVYATSASTDTSNSAEAMYVKSVMTGAGGVGGRSRFHLYTDVALGGWSNALKALAEYGSAGSTAGLGSALCAELILSAGTSSGTYAALEAELSFGTTGVTGTKTSFLYCNTDGTAKTTFDTSGVFLHVGDGITAAATKFCSANYQSLKCYFTDGDTTRYMVLSQTENGLGLGVSGTPMSVVMDGTKPLSVYTTSASADGATNLEPVVFHNTLTGIGQVGGRTLAYMTTNVALGSWSNALKAHVVYGASGRTNGLGSALCCELDLNVGTTQGTYAPLEIELTGQSGCSLGTQTALIYANVGGDGVATVNQGYFLIIGTGIADTNNGIWEANDVTATDFTHALRCNIDGTDMWIGLHTDKDFTD